MKKLALLFVPFLLGAQTLTLNAPATVRPGATINIDVTLAAPGNTVALQWSTAFPTGYSGALNPGATSTAASKQIACTSDLQTLCLAYGLNANVFAPGVVATYSVKVPISATPGKVLLPLIKSQGVDATGTAVAITSTSTSFTVLASQDLNGDGTVDTADVQLMVNEVLGGACKDDQNGDGKCDLVDVVLVILRALAGNN